jgi:oligopeptide transport system substrate-binding protein
VAVVVQENWKAIGVECTLQGTETQIHYDNLRAKNFVAGDGGWVADYNDPRNYLYLLETRTGPQNYPGYNNPEFDQLMRQQDNEPNLVKRAAILRQAEQLILDDAPVCPIVFGVSKNLVDPRIDGYADNLTDIHRARYFRIKSET